ncbi:beta-hexosaminidase [Bacillus sp. SRB_336]|nr:beta-hexosaminidase [Bacillus sp. SRB_336]
MARCLGGLIRPMALGVVLLGVAHAAGAATPALIPQPVHVEHQPGTCRVTAHTVVSVRAGDAESLRTARYLVDLVRRTRGLILTVKVQTQAPVDAIRLVRDARAPVEQPEGYLLSVSERGIEVRARSEAGVFYGAMTLWQLLTPDTGHGDVAVADVSIRDWPRFRWRGLMLDSARHFQSVATVKRVLDAMARHKLNVFHWHLTDDQGWRLQIKRYPKLTEVGAWRTPPGAGTNGEPGRYGGFYTQAQVRDIVAYATARRITVVPELDMPGHAQAAVASYPDLVGVTGQRPGVSVNWGVNPYLYNTDAKSLAFIENVLDEVMGLFPSNYIHVGGDEAIKDQWKASPAVQAQMKRLGIKDENALQSWFIDQIGHYLDQHGRRLIGWDEILEGGLPASASVMSWRGTQGAIDAAKLGHDVVLAPGGSLYFDHLQSERSDEPNGRYDVLPLETVYAFDPVAASLSPDEARHVLGTEAALWSEFLPSAWHVEHALFPRIDALAEVAWSPPAARDWRGFLARLPAQLHRYRALQIPVADSAYAVDITLNDGANAALASGKARVSLGNQVSDGEIHYTIDGSAPTLASPHYAGPFEVTLPVTVRARPFAFDGSALATTRDRVFDGAALRTLSSSELKPCPGGDYGLRMPLLPDLGAPNTPVYNVDIFKACKVYPAARLDGITAIRVHAARLPRNLGLAHDQVKVTSYSKSTAYGELEVRLDNCDGALLARLPLPAGTAPGTRMTLGGAMPTHTGAHDLCLRFTAPSGGPLYAIGTVRLIESSSGHAARHLSGESSP